MNTFVFNRSIQMRLYSMHKREFGLVFLAFFACFGMSVFIGLAGILNKKSFKISIAHNHRVLFVLLGPPITSTTLTKVSQVNTNHLNGSDMATGPFALTTPLLTSYHQQFWVLLYLF